MSATLLYACFENESKLRWGRVGEQLGVMHDIKSGIVSLDYYNRTNFFGIFFFLKSSLLMQRSDLYPHSESVWFSCLKTSYCI